MARRDPFVSGLMPVVDEQTKAAAMRAAAPASAPTPAPVATDARAALAKLTSNQTLSNAERATLGMSPAVAPVAQTPVVDPNSVEGRKAKVRADVEAVQEATPKPELSAQEIADGFIIKWIGTTNGRWQVIAPSAAEISAKRQAAENANYTGSGTKEDPFLFKGKPFTGNKGVGSYVNGILQDGGGTNNTKKGDVDKTLVSTDIDNATGDTIGYFSDGSKLVLNKGTGPVQSAEFKDAYALLNQTFRDYGLEGLVPAIEGFMKRNLGPNQAAIELRATPEYIKRFKGNDVRRATGKNALTEAEYLAVEDAYDQTLRAYGQQNYFGIDRKTKQEKTAELIGNDISAVEFKDRIQLAVDRVQNADPMTKDVLKQFYPTLNESDLIGYFLNPNDNLPKLQEKVTASEIGAAAKGLNLATDVATATDLAKYGVTQAQAREGYSNISAVLPTARKLGDIYNETGIKYAQAEGEAEVFKGNQDAATKRKRLASMERAAFSGSSGTGQSSLTRSTQGLL